MSETKWVIVIASIAISTLVAWLFVRKKSLEVCPHLPDGYPVYLVKDEEWFESENKFEEFEWAALNKKYPGLNWLIFKDGKIYALNPTSEKISALVLIAKGQGWLVEGWDGEKYED